MSSKANAALRIERCPSPFCGRPFQLNRFHAALSVLTEPGKITCPHCGIEIAGAPDSIFLAHALLPSEEVAYMARVGGDNVHTLPA